MSGEDKWLSIRQDERGTKRAFDASGRTGNKKGFRESQGERGILHLPRKGLCQNLQAGWHTRGAAQYKM
jgi:hypothetical protein